MAIRLSSALRTSMMGSYGLGLMMNYGVIKVFSGPQPDTADAAEQGTLLARVTQNGLPFSYADQTAGLQLQLGQVAGSVRNLGDWVLTPEADGTPGWWRWCWANPDAGTAYELAARIDGLVGEGLYLQDATLAASDPPHTLGAFAIYLPAYL